jgi:carboxypeptidase Q
MRIKYRGAILAGAVAMLLVATQLGFPQSSARGPAGDGTLKSLAAVAGEAMMDSHAYEYLTELSDDIGARVTGSPGASKAIEWSLAKMKAMGLENVHAESWQMSRGWTRISAEAELEAPIQRKLMVDSMGWVGSTPAGGVEADVVAVNVYDLKNEMQQNSTKWAGKILVIVQAGAKPAQGFDTFAQFGTFLRSAYAAHAGAVIGGQGGRKAAGMHLTHTGVLGFDTFYDLPVVSMAAEDQDQLERYLGRGVTPRLKINVQNHVTDGPVQSANVVSEIRGTEHPEQIVVMGGHLDSWDLASGTTDNGMGTCSTLGAAEAIQKSGMKPRRTIRFVLFTGEEEGLLGSQAYVKQHDAEIANHLAAVVLDNGQGPVKAFNMGGRDDLIAAMEPFAKSLVGFGKIDVDDATEFGTDTGPFILKGLPGINLDQDSPDYKYTHHSPVDTLDKVNQETLIQDAGVMALTGFWIADRDERLAAPWPPEKTARKLIEKRDDSFLKNFGLWPFGNLGQEPEKKNP